MSVPCRSQFAQCFRRIGHLRVNHAGMPLGGQLFTHHRHRALGNGRADKLVAVHHRAAGGHEHIAGLHQAGIRLHARHLPSRGFARYVAAVDFV